MQRTALYKKHLDLGAKIVPFAGWEMPIQYEGIISEHNAVRNHVGVFDVSHMGKINVIGQGAADYLDHLSTNKVKNKKEGGAVYTVWCHENGGAVDDVIIYKESDTKFFVIVNGLNREKDLQHMINHSKNFDVEIEDEYETNTVLAVQGKMAMELLPKLFPACNELKFFHFRKIPFLNEEIIISRTGYTGSPGFEIYAPSSIAESLWDHIFSFKEEFNISPIGLGARDTLRLEMGYALYGHELTDTILPTESVSSWTVKLDKENFLGKEALTKEPTRHEVALMVKDQGIPREGYEVFKDQKKIGSITSGTLSPTLQKGIALALVDMRLNPDEEVQIQIRKNQVTAKVVNLPFVKV